MRTVTAAILVFIMLAGALVHSTAGTFGIDEKIALENSIAKRIEDVTVRMTGDSNVIVLVNIEHNPTIEQEVKKAAPPAATPAVGGNTDNYLPGIPMDALETEVIGNADGSFTQTIRLPEFVKTLSVTMILSNEVSDATLNSVREYISGLVKINEARGDRLDVSKMTFAENKQERTKFIRDVAITQMPWLIGLLMLAFFIFGPLRSFMKNMISAIEVFRIQADTRIVSRSEIGVKSGGRGEALRAGGIIGEIGTSHNAGVSGGEGVRSLPESSLRHFGFINESNIGSLLYLLKNETPDMVAIVLTYLPREYSGSIINALPETLRKDTLKKMAVVKQYHGEDIRVIEDRLKERVDYLLGGPQNIAELINAYEKDEREKVLQDIGREDPATETAIRSMLVTVDDLAKLSKEHLYEIYKAIGTRIFAAALKGTAVQVRDYVMKNLTEGARDMLRQEMELIPKDISAARLSQVKKDMITAMKRLEDQGSIRIPRDISVAAPNTVRKSLSQPS